MPLARRIFSREFKIHICEEIESKFKTHAEVSREHSLADNLISRWIAEYRKNPSSCFTGMGNKSIDPQSNQNTRIKELEAALGRATFENQVLREANALLKKVSLERKFIK